VKKILSFVAFAALAAIFFSFIPQGSKASKVVFGQKTQDEIETAKRISLEILSQNPKMQGLSAADNLAVQRVDIDELGMAHTKVRQNVNGIPVWEGEAIVHLRRDGTLSTVTDELKGGISVDTNPNYSADDAVNLAVDGYRGNSKLTNEPKVDMWIYRGADRDHLAYRVKTERVDGGKDTAAPVIFIDAQTGEKLFEYNDLKTATGASLYSGTVTFDTSSVGSTFYMEDLTRRIGTFNMNSTGNESTGTGGTQSRYTDTDDVWDATIQRAGVDAQYGAVKTFDYYNAVHNRNGINGSGGPGTTTAAANSSIALIVSRVHFGSSGAYNNAFWFNNQMTYGDGNGTTFSPLTTLDVAGHEMTHGVTEYTANLTYASESGALNEGMSDIFGAMVERYARGGVVDSDTWKIGEQCYTPSVSGDALRYMANPHGNGSQTSGGNPDHYSERLYQGSCSPSGSNDYCGVHTNSSIANKAFYLTAAGGTHHLSGVTTTGIGASDAERIYYRALAFYMTASTNFAGARTATLNAATDLFGSTSAQYTSVATAWCAVGVGSCPGGGGGGGTELLVNGAFETSLSPWVKSGTGALYTANGSTPHGGTGYAYFGNANNRTGQTYQQVAIPTTATGTLTFYLNVTSAETTTTTQYDKLFVEVRNTSGTLLTTLATYSNLNKTPSGYQQKSLNVAAYKGQTVRIQFRATTDSSLVTTFRVDTASLK
jgi:thermolysin